MNSHDIATLRLRAALALVKAGSPRGHAALLKLVTEALSAVQSPPRRLRTTPYVGRNRASSGLPQQPRQFSKWVHPARSLRPRAHSKTRQKKS